MSSAYLADALTRPRDINLSAASMALLLIEHGRMEHFHVGNGLPTDDLANYWTWSKYVCRLARMGAVGDLEREAEFLMGAAESAIAEAFLPVAAGCQCTAHRAVAAADQIRAAEVGERPEVQRSCPACQTPYGNDPSDEGEVLTACSKCGMPQFRVATDIAP